MNIIPFESTQLPAHVLANAAEVNSDLTGHAGMGFPVLSIKGKVWAVVRDKEREVLKNPKDPDAAATSIEVVIIKANPKTSKVFYVKGYDPNQSEGVKPDCFSGDGEKPDPSSEKPQCTTCAACPHNQWGSKISDNGSKGKACQDSVRLAVAPSGQLNDPHLLRVPPASIRGLAEYGQMLAKRGVAYTAVVTKIAFDIESESPKLTFRPVGFLATPEDVAMVKETADSPVITSIIGASPALGTQRAPEGETPAPAPAPAAAAPAAETPAKRKPGRPARSEETPAKPAPTPAAAPAAEAPASTPAPAADLELELDGIDFDDE